MSAENPERRECVREWGPRCRLEPLEGDRARLYSIRINDQWRVCFRWQNGDAYQYLSAEQLAAIIMAVHRITQLSLPLLVVGTGLPQLPALAGNAKSYSERLFDYPDVGALSRDEAFEAIRLPAEAEGAEIEDQALAGLFRITKGYPYFIQEWAYSVWNAAPRSPITLADVERIEPEVLTRLDESFFRMRYDRTTDREKRYLRAMAELGEGPHRSGDIAAVMKVKVESLSA